MRAYSRKKNLSGILPGYFAPMAILGNFLYVLEAGEDDLISLIKYEIGGE